MSDHTHAAWLKCWDRNSHAWYILGVEGDGVEPFPLVGPVREEADADLIASSPRLLAAARLARETLRQIDTGLRSARDTAYAIDALDAAIAQAAPPSAADRAAAEAARGFELREGGNDV